MISIVIPVKNDRAIDACIETLLPLNTKKQPIEIVVVDASTDGALDDIKQKYKSVTWLYYSNPHKSYTVAEQRNLGVTSARGEWIIFLDADCVPETDWLPNLLAPALNDGELYVTGKVKSTTPTIHDTLWEKLEDVRYRHSSGTCNSLINRSVFDRVGHFDEDYEAGEDVDFSWRAIDAGFKIRYTPDAIVYDDWGTMRQDFKRAIRYGEAKTLLYAKHPDRLRNPMIEFTTLTYVAYILLLPLTIVWPWYPLAILLPALKNWRYKPFHVIAFSLPLAWGVIRGVFKLPFTLRKKTRPGHNSRRLLILTQRLGSNYGGIVQAFALQTVLARRGYDAITNNRLMLKRDLSHILAYLSRFAPWNISKPKGVFITPKLYGILTQNTRKFVTTHIRTIDLFERGRPDPAIVNSFDYFVVGSDQVWRRRYANITQNLLDFVTRKDARRVAYAASFGHDNIDEYGATLVRLSAELAKRFDAISVREKSGVEICAKEWGVEAAHVLDPTLLLSRQDYLDVVPTELLHKKPSQIFTYILDTSTAKQAAVAHITKSLNLTPYSLLPPQPPSRRAMIADPDKYALPPVEAWLAAFANSKFVITDSFHGCVFAIIFNKPFIAIGNDKRGMARFDSLLKTFELEDRLVTDADQITTELATQNIDWRHVNRIIARERKNSLQFLDLALGREDQ